MLDTTFKSDLHHAHSEKKVLSFFEFWPTWLFYLPVYAYVALLMVRHRSFMLPTAVNPQLANGKFVGESKDEILSMAAQYLPEYSVKHCAVIKGGERDQSNCLALTEKSLMVNGIQYPLVVKPNLGCRGAGVNLIHNPEELKRYIEVFPNHEVFICQELIPYEAEAGIFYCRMPWEQSGRIISLTLKSFPSVTGDGKHSLRELIAMDSRASQLTKIYHPRHQANLERIPLSGEIIRLVFAGNHSKGAIFKNGHDQISSLLTVTVDQLAKRLPNFFFGRLDIRYASFEQLEKGLDCKIVEINGASSESTHIWDANYGLFRAWRDLFVQFDLLFSIGKYNRQHGFKTQAFTDFYQSYQRDRKLSKQYPGTH